jgi:hypothetical protein
MQNKYLAAIISDTHFGQKAHNKGIFESQMLFFEEQFFPYLLKNKIKDVFHLGDLVHNRNVIDLWILQQLKTRFFRWFENNKINIHCLVGNHDTYYRSSLEYSFQCENLREFEYTKIYDRPANIELGKYRIGVVPWLVDCENYSFSPDVDMLFGHFDIQGMPMMNNIFSREGFTIDTFKQYKHVFTGHYHISSDKDNIHYIGTQYQLTWNDFGQSKGFIALRDNFKYDFIQNDITPAFVKIYYEDTLGLNIRAATLQGEPVSISVETAIDLAKNNYIKLFVEKCGDQMQLDNLYASLIAVSKNDYKIEIINTEEIIEDYDFSDFEAAIDAEASTIDLIMNYISGMTFEKGIDKDLLTSLSKGLYQEAYDENLGGEV